MIYTQTKLTFRLRRFINVFDSCKTIVNAKIHERRELDLRLELNFFSLFSLFSLESFRPRPRVHHLSLSFFIFNGGAAASLEATFGMLVTSPKAPQDIPSKAARDFFFLIITISPMSGSIVGSTNISKPPLAEMESPPTRRTTSERSFPRSFSLSRPMERMLSFDFLGTKRLRGGSTSCLGAKGTGTDAQDSSRERWKEVLASEDKPVADGVAEMRRIEGIGGGPA